MKLLEDRKIAVDADPDGPRMAGRQGLRPGLWRAAAQAEGVIRSPTSELDGPDVPSIVSDRDSGKPVMSAVFPTVGYRMFAPTAAMIYQFREVGLHGRATRVAGMGQPEFTRG
jgi:hypothetical protein